MADKKNSGRESHGDSGSVIANTLDRSRCQHVKMRLLEEIQALESQLALLKNSSEAMDFSAQQTCREMIHSRQQLYRQLDRDNERGLGCD